MGSYNSSTNNEYLNITSFINHNKIIPLSQIWAYGHMQKNMAKWGIPEKRIKNPAQRCYPEVPRTLQSKVMAKSRFGGISPCISP